MELQFVALIQQQSTVGTELCVLISASVSDSVENHSGVIEGQNFKHESSYGALDCRPASTASHNGDIGMMVTFCQTKHTT